MRRARLALWLAFGLGVAGVLLALPSVARAQPVVVETILRTTPGGTIRGYIATIDLTDPSVEIVVDTPGTTVGQITAARTDTWRSTVGARLAVNANYFGTVSGSTLSIVGLAVSNGQVVSNARQFGSTLPGDPAITFSADRVPSVGYIAPGATTGVWDAVAGVGPSNTDTDPGTLLITDGVNTGATARVTPLVREPRTAVGMNQAGTRLYIIVIDGRQSTWSVGVTLPELADLLLAKGVWRAINLDGGSSSSFVYVNDLGVTQQNRPSGGSHAAVATHLGIRINNPAPITDRVVRPVRGAWLRPTNLTTFETTMAALAPAGIQDIFIETLYWGRDTALNNVSEFPSRFGFDFLQQAIPIAARYGVRVHAWCETGYLDFGTNPSALLVANPDWVIRHVSVARNGPSPNSPCATPNTLTGDLASQRFVNLGNPGVRAALSKYFTALATNYPGLEGIQADYHFFSLGNPPNNQNNTAPWSYDNWTLANYRDASGNAVNPLSFATTCDGTVTYNSSTWVVTSGAHSNWINWNRDNVTEALAILHASVAGVTSSPLFSAVSFGSWSSPIHLSKMIDLPGWGTRFGADAFFIMAYNTSTAGITTELQNAQTALPGQRVVAGLANLTNQTRPTVTQQLDTMKARGIEDFNWFDAPTFVSNSAGTQATLRSQLQTWLATSATRLQGDVTATGTSNGADGYIDARDLQWFDTVYTGTPVTRTAANDRCDLNRDGVIDATDRSLLRRAFGRFHFGPDDVVDARDIQACINAFTPGPAPVASILNLWDLNGDGRVDYLDQLVVHSYLTVPVAFDYDVNRNGTVDLEDLYILSANFSVDVNRDGVRDSGDQIALARFLRAGETQGITAGAR